MRLFDGGAIFLVVLVLFGYGVSVLERSSDDAGVVTKPAVKEVVDHDIDFVTDKASEYYAESKVLYPDGYNQAWYTSAVNE